MKYEKYGYNIPVSIYEAQELYDLGNDEVKEYLCNIFSRYMLEADLKNLGKLHGSVGTGCCGSQERAEFLLVRNLKNKISFKDSKYADNDISKELYDELLKLSDDKLLLVYWHIPREGNDFVSGFYEINSRFRIIPDYKSMYDVSIYVSNEELDNFLLMDEDTLYQHIQSLDYDDFKEIYWTFQNIVKKLEPKYFKYSAIERDAKELGIELYYPADVKEKHDKILEEINKFKGPYGIIKKAIGDKQDNCFPHNWRKCGCHGYHREFEDFVCTKCGKEKSE